MVVVAVLLLFSWVFDNGKVVGRYIEIFFISCRNGNRDGGGGGK